MVDRDVDAVAIPCVPSQAVPVHPHCHRGLISHKWEAANQAALVVRAYKVSQRLGGEGARGLLGIF